MTDHGLEIERPDIDSREPFSNGKQDRGPLGMVKAVLAISLSVFELGALGHEPKIERDWTEHPATMRIERHWTVLTTE